MATAQRISRAEKKAATRERLLKAAERIATREGFARLSLDRVAEAAGLTKGAIYSNFESKEDLLLQVADRLTVGLNANDVVLGAAEVGELTDRLGDALIGFITDRTKEATIALEFMAVALRDRKLRKLVQNEQPTQGGEAEVDRWFVEHAPDLPVSPLMFQQAVDALALGLMFRRLLWGEEQMTDDAIRWAFRQLGKR